MSAQIAAWAASTASRVCIVGPGAVGTLFAVRLHRAGVPTLLLDYKTDRADRLLKRGFQLLQGDAQPGVRDSAANAFVPITADISQLASASSSLLYVLILVKAHQTLAVAKSLLPHLQNPASTCLVTLQNGIGNVEALREAMGNSESAWKGRILAGTTSQGARIEAEGVVRDTGVGMNLFGPADDAEGGKGLAKELGKLFQKGGLPFSLAPTPAATMTAIFNKAIINAALNPVAALTRLPNGLCGTPGSETLEIMSDTALEAAIIAGAHGVQDLPPDRSFWKQKLQQVAKATAPNHNSMLVDVLKKRKTEVGQINGAFVKLAAKKGLASPCNSMLAGLIARIESQYDNRVAE